MPFQHTLSQSLQNMQRGPPRRGLEAWRVSPPSDDEEEEEEAFSADELPSRRPSREHYAFCDMTDVELDSQARMAEQFKVCRRVECGWQEGPGKGPRV